MLETIGARLDWGERRQGEEAGCKMIRRTPEQTVSVLDDDPSAFL